MVMDEIYSKDARSRIEALRRREAWRREAWKPDYSAYEGYCQIVRDDIYSRDKLRRIQALRRREAWRKQIFETLVSEERQKRYVSR
jgi:hypothetical protein